MGKFLLMLCGGACVVNGSEGVVFPCISYGAKNLCHASQSFCLGYWASYGAHHCGKFHIQLTFFGA